MPSAFGEAISASFPVTSDVVPPAQRTFSRRNAIVTTRMSFALAVAASATALLQAMVPSDEKG